MHEAADGWFRELGNDGAPIDASENRVNIIADAIVFIPGLPGLCVQGPVI